MIMLNLPKQDESLFVTELLPDEDNLGNLKKDIDRDFGTTRIDELFGLLKNEVSINRPQLLNLDGLLGENEFSIGSNASMNDLNFYSYYLVRFGCTFLPLTDNCNFTWARFKVELNSSVKKDEDSSPIATDLFPSKINKSVASKGYTFKPVVDVWGIEFGLELQKQASATHRIEVFSFGKFRSSFGWDFRALGNLYIDGDKETVAVIKSPKDVSVTAKFSLSAEILTKGFAIPLSKYRKNKLANTVFTLITSS